VRAASQFAIALLLVSTARASGESTVAIRLLVDPPQPIRAVALRAGGEVHACAVQDGHLIVPAGLPLPWTVAQLRFEPTSYTARELEARAPLLLRALGELKIRFRPPPAPAAQVEAFLLRNREEAAQDVVLTRDGEGNFRTSLAAGTYAGAFFTGARGTRIRSGIVVAPRQVTEIADLSLEPTASVSLRVVDGKTKRPVPGATVKWSPPPALNAEIARHLFRRFWSATTDRSGLVTFPQLGPPPVPARWSVEAPGYALTLTQQVLVAETSRMVVPDTQLRPESIIVVNFLAPREAEDFRGATLIVCAPEGEDSARYEPFLRQSLREGENKLSLGRFGKIRFLIEAKGGRKLLYHDVELSPEDQSVVIAPLATEIHGVVRRQDIPVEGVLMTAADGRDARMIVARATTDRSGRYSLTTFQSGEVLLYTSGPYANRAAAESMDVAPMFKTLRLGGDRQVRADFQFPTSGATIAVIDAKSRAPLRARLRGTLEARGRASSIALETDDKGIARIAGAREGSAKVSVRARGYRALEVTLPVGDPASNHTIALTPGGIIRGRVLDLAGAPLSGALILGGYPGVLAMQGYIQSVTDSSGRFEIESPPEPGAPVYVVASGHALGVFHVRDGVDPVVRLAPPNAGAVRLVAGQNAPGTLSLFLAAPRGGAIIPSGVFDDLARVNGLSLFQLNSTATDGTLILPEFLPPGSYTLYRMRTPDKPFAEIFDPVAELRVPARAGSVLSIPE
jgi:hypothetical protein